MQLTPMIARNIDEVITHLETIIHDSKKNGDRIGYFAVLYHKVTVAVKEGIAGGQFGDGITLERLDVLFANRYLHALYQWRAGKPISKSWEVAFKAAAMGDKLILQHLLLGINAHINLDLGIAVVEAAGGADLDTMRADYNSINLILSSLSYGVINNLNTVSPFLSFLGFTGTASNSMLVQFSLGNARDGSWCFADDLTRLTADKRPAFIQQRDKEISDLGALLQNNKGTMKLLVWVIRLFEWKDVNRVINILYTRKKLKMKEVAS